MSFRALGMPREAKLDQNTKIYDVVRVVSRLSNDSTSDIFLLIALEGFLRKSFGNDRSNRERPAAPSCSPPKFCYRSPELSPVSRLPASVARARSYAH